MAEILVPPGGHTALSDPASVLLELVDESRQRPGMTEAEAYAFLAGADRGTSELPKIVVAAAEVHTGAMIALVPSEVDLDRLVVEDGEPRDQLHTTLVYLGEADDVSPNAKRALVTAVKRTLGGRGEVVGEGFAISVFNPPGHVKEDGKEHETCVVLTVSGREMERMHQTVVSLAEDVAGRGLELPEQHVPWIPHVTLAYTDEVSRVQALTDRVGPITYDRIRLAFAGEVVDVPLVS